MKNRSIIKMVVFLGVAMFGTLASAELILSDTFTTNETRTAGSNLHGSSLETGGTTWDSSTVPKVNSGGWVFSASANNFIAKAALPDLSLAQVIEFQTDVYVTGTGPQALLGFGVSTANGNWQEGVRISLKGNGAYGVSYYDTAVNVIASGTGTDYTAFTFNTVKMAYNVQNNTLSAWVNSQQVVTDHDLGSFTPTLDVAGISALSPTTSERWDNFSVTTIPEPASVSLMAMSALSILMMRRFAIQQ